MDLESIFESMTRREMARSEATIQSEIRNFLLVGPFDLAENHLDVELESTVSGRRRIDIEVGRAVIEVKKDLRKGKVLDEAVVQLCSYVIGRQRETGFRYVGIITDGVDWYCYHLQVGFLIKASQIKAKSFKSDSDKLILWIDGVLSTAKKIPPTPKEVRKRLGYQSSSHCLDRSSLFALYQENKNKPSVQIKRQLWARLLFSALGTQFVDEDDLFIEHTLLVNSSEIIAHAVLGLDVNEIQPQDLLTGAKFDNSGIFGVVDSDFFDWVIEVSEGEQFVKSLAQRLSRFEWSDVEHDILKVLYESIILPETRKKLGEYYTPDWLAEAITEVTITDPLNSKVLDPSCGSGTFLFYAIKLFIKDAETQNLPIHEMLELLSQSVIGIDLHPVAVALARVTYLLAIGKERITNPSRGAIHVPIYLGDSLQLRQHEEDLWSSGYLVIQADLGKEYYSSQLKFPESLLENEQVFDELVKEMAKKAVNRVKNGSVPSLSGTFRRLKIPEITHQVLSETFTIMCRLHDEGRNHIWGYFIRNLARPYWLSRKENRVDQIIGNPPWLPYRDMTSDMQKAFKKMCEDRHLWEGAKVATHQDLSSLFVVRACQLYLKNGGNFALVMPNASLDRIHFKGFREGVFPDPVEPLSLKFSNPWDLKKIRPHFFPRGASVIFGERSEEAKKLEGESLSWIGKVDNHGKPWAVVSKELERVSSTITQFDHHDSPYKKRFKNGATIVPRMLFMIEHVESGPLGIAKGKTKVKSSISAAEKKPWKNLPRPEGIIEEDFIFKTYLGENLLPFRFYKIRESVMPIHDGKFLNKNDLSLYPGLESWWQNSSIIWEKHRSSPRLNLQQQLDYRSKLSIQFPIPDFRVIYNSSGMHLSAALDTSKEAIIEHSLYWASVETKEEARYLCAILNAPRITELVRPFMSYGKDERHFDKYLWKLPIPLFDNTNAFHRKLSNLGKIMEEKIKLLELNHDKYFPYVRRELREFISNDEHGKEISVLVEQLLS